MCGIVGYTGRADATPVLLDALTRMEYRGYDSAGVAVQNGNGLDIRKVAGSVRLLRDDLVARPVSGITGIGHTRWATHGAPTCQNAHPHTDCSGRFAVVHNGIIENAEVLRQHLTRLGHHFGTDTDTEVLAHLIEEEQSEDLAERVAAALAHVEGTYGLAVMDSQRPGTIIAARRGSPLLLGLSDGEFFVASDPAAVMQHTRSAIFLDDGDIVTLEASGYRIWNASSGLQNRPVDEIKWELEAIELGGFPHFMLKEIYEQPRAVRNTLRSRLLMEDGDARLDGLNLSPEDCAAIRRIIILGCGTSWHAGLIGRHFIEELAEIPVQVEYASEYRYQKHLDASDALVVVVSQSGETADTLEALHAARAAGGKIVGLVNVVGSTIAREADGGIYLHAGPEIGVASTKAFTCQITAFLLLALYLGRRRGLSRERGRELVRDIDALPDLIERALELDASIKEIARDCIDARDFLYLGRGLNFPVALEGALKLKEVSYIHAEGYPAAEMKHGPIALVDEDMWVVVVAPKDAVYAKIVSNMEEIRARGGRLMAISSEGNGDLSRLAEHQICVPATSPIVSPLITVVPLQLLAYHVAVLRGLNVDRPRNLAKSVTVE